MTRTKDIQHSPAFYKQLFSKAFGTIFLILSIGVIEIWLLGFIKPIAMTAIVVVALVKTFFIVQLTFNQLGKIIGQSHLLSHVLVLFALLIGLIVVSFATDFTGSYLTEPNQFKSMLESSSSKSMVFFEFLYYSLITFSSVGFGDIVPISVSGKFLVMLEIVLSFFVLVFGIANIDRIHVGNNIYNKKANN